MSRQSDDERALLARIAAKDRPAFEALYQRYYRRLFAYLLRITRRPEMVEELVNDVMFTIWRSASRFDLAARPSSWIFGIAYRQALKALSRLGPERRRAEWNDDELRRSAQEPGAGPERMLHRRQLSGLLDRALGKLSPEQRAVVELTYFHGYSYPEIAAIVRCPVNTVKTRMFHARRRLRSVLPGLGVSSSNG